MSFIILPSMISMSTLCSTRSHSSLYSLSTALLLFSTNMATLSTVYCTWSYHFSKYSKTGYYEGSTAQLIAPLTSLTHQVLWGQTGADSLEHDGLVVSDDHGPGARLAVSALLPRTRGAGHTPALGKQGPGVWHQGEAGGQAGDRPEPGQVTLDTLTRHAVHLTVGGQQGVPGPGEVWDEVQGLLLPVSRVEDEQLEPDIAWWRRDILVSVGAYLCLLLSRQYWLTLSLCTPFKENIF